MTFEGDVLGVLAFFFSLHSVQPLAHFPLKCYGLHEDVLLVADALCHCILEFSSGGVEFRAFPRAAHFFPGYQMPPVGGIG